MQTRGAQRSNSRRFQISTGNTTQSLSMMKICRKSILIKSNMYMINLNVMVMHMINLNVMVIAIVLNSNLTSKQKNKKILQVLETV